jgi:transposase
MNIKNIIEKFIDRDPKEKECKNVSCEKVDTLQCEINELKIQIKDMEVELKEKDELTVNLIKELNFSKERIRQLEGQLRKNQSDKYGTSSEKNKYKDKKAPETEAESNETDAITNDTKPNVDEIGKKKERGGQKGHKGNGRKIPDKVPKVEHFYKIPDNKCRCPICGKKYRIIKNFQRKSHEIEINIEIIVHVHNQEVYEKECNCDASISELIVAPKPKNIIYKSIFSMKTWCELLALKYLVCIPVNRFNRLFPCIDYDFSPSTIHGGFKKILEIMRPMNNAILEYNQHESRWNADETRWCRLYDPDSDKRRLYWVWAFKGKKTVVYVIDPTRSKKVPEKHFENTKDGIINIDRFKSYNVLSEKLILSYCWQHQKRDFDGIEKKYLEFKDWVCEWIKKIEKIEQINYKRCEKYKQNQPYEDEQKELESKVNEYFILAEKELAGETLDDERKKVIKSIFLNKTTGNMSR